MSVSVRGIENAGDLAQERLVLKVLKDTDAGKYLVMRVRSTGPTTVAGGPVEEAYWIPDKAVKAGDFVVVYSKVGTASEKPGATGATSHFFYWGRSTPVWGDGKAAVVVQIALWNVARVGEVASE